MAKVRFSYKLAVNTVSDKGEIRRRSEGVTGGGGGGGGGLWSYL